MRQVLLWAIAVLAAILLIIGCASRSQPPAGESGPGGQARTSADPKEARERLEQMGIPYSEASFVEKAGQGDVEAVKLFLAAGIRPDARGEPDVPGNVYRPTALVKAAERGQAEVVRILVAGGVDLKAADRDGYNQGESALWSAVAMNHSPVVQCLLDAGVDPNIRQSGGRTVLMAVAWHPWGENPDMVRALVRAGAKVGARDTAGETALFRAVQDLRCETVRILVEAGANVNAKNGRGESALGLVERRNLWAESDRRAAAEIAKMLRAAGAK